MKLNHLRNGNNSKHDPLVSATYCFTANSWLETNFSENKKGMGENNSFNKTIMIIIIVVTYDIIKYVQGSDPDPSSLLHDNDPALKCGLSTLAPLVLS